MEPEKSLRELAEEFASDLTVTVHGVVGTNCPPFQATTLESSAGARASVRQQPDTGISLTVSGRPLLTLKVNYECIWDGPGTYLAVSSSAFEVYVGAKAAGEPLYRYDYERDITGGLPAAHLQIHAHRDGLTYVMARAGDQTKRGKARAAANEVPRMSQLHFPVGGHRFRPALEDVLGMLVTELGIDHQDGWRHSLEALRVKLR